LATNQKRASLIAEDLISTYKNQNTTVEKSFRFLKDSKFFADAMFLHKPERIEAMLMIMSLSLLFYSATEYMFQKKLKESEEKLPNQKSKEVDRISLRWLFSLFRRIFILTSIENNILVKRVLHLELYHRKALGILGVSYERMYLSTG
jgi:transposase